ncbi:PilZ domain-containing protein [Chitinivibrio alkaliphilus]|uniref:Type IV pilus assembly PilZ n=1 Tax=Chitinivibrio alkaliphilus ACht1 TaxID=1313304 RepID=U7D5R4_9BACT|nr:PilZ domain-containing protein [Chitinivibrio alkaliphilus]ERP30891.1 type IV pilus assembly PilZ [Chitinivibrio alkaliphilus ACht1]
MGAEKRREQREHLIFYLKIYHGADKEFLGRLGDLSRKGILLISKDAHTPGKTIPLSIDISDLHILSAKKSIECTALVRWSHKDINPDHYLTGFEIIDIASQDVEIIEKVVDSIGFAH